MRVRRFVGFVAAIQLILLAVHFLLYETWAFSPTGPGYGSGWLGVITGVLAVSFVGASLLAFRYSNAAVRLFYRGAAVWLGLLTFLSLAAAVCWIVFSAAQLVGLSVNNFHGMAEWLFAGAIAAGVYGLVNAGATRITRASVKLQNLPEAWRGRKAALVSDIHLGHVRNSGFLRGLVAKIVKEEPDAIFIAGDLF
ncbi:MAG TPA: hypothetical protein VE998_09065, partial [Terriglobales bacterium]|nr:hypothetical protein [Terriglobales bacterium]